MQIKKYTLSLVLLLVLFFSASSFVFAEDDTEAGLTGIVTTTEEPTTPVVLPTGGGTKPTIGGVDFNAYKALTCIPYLSQKDPTDNTKCSIPLNSETGEKGGLNGFLAKAYNIGIGLAIALTILRIVHGGFLYATVEAATGKSDAKKIIQNAVLGLLLALGSYLLLNLISPDLTKFAVNITKVDVKAVTNLSATTPNTPTAPINGKPNTTIGNCAVPESDIVAAGGVSGGLHKDVAPKWNAMYGAAAKDGITLSGSGFRSDAAQLAIWKSRCNGTCGAPVARPCSLGGSGSNHRGGKAIDVNGTGGNSTTFKWLKTNASKFGFYNLPSESWHWSTTGN